MTGERKIDPIGLELVKNALYSITDEMMVTIIRTAHSSNIKNVMDFSTAVFNKDGEMLCSGAGLRIHLGSMPDAMQAFLNKYKNKIYPGDVLILNDPFEGGMHLPDINIFTPIFVDGELFGFAGTVCHHVDIGGRVAGGNASDSTNIFQEGLRIPPLKYYEKGQPNESLFAIIDRNVRLPMIIREDLRAQIAACNIAGKRFLELVTKYGRDNFKKYAEELLNYSERIARREISEIPDGVYEFEDIVEGDETHPGFIPLRVKLTVNGESMVIDFSGSSPQVRSAINCNLINTKSACYAAVREVMRSRIPSNGGYFRPITVVAESGSVCNAVMPASVGGRGLIWARLVSLVAGALAKAVPNRVSAAGQDSPNGVSIGGWDKERKPFVFLEFFLLGTGGRPGADGIECNLDLSNAPAEMIEREFPIAIQEFSYVSNTGGAGKYRSGLAVVRSYRVLADEAEAQVRSDRREIMAYGVQGGKVGTPSELYLYRANGENFQLPGRATFTMYRGDILRSITAAGGGWGNPLERDPEQVVQDVLNEKFTVEYAKKEYGVVINKETLCVDISATTRLRRQMMQSANSLYALDET